MRVEEPGTTSTSVARDEILGIIVNAHEAVSSLVSEDEDGDVNVYGSDEKEVVDAEVVSQPRSGDLDKTVSGLKEQDVTYAQVPSRAISEDMDTTISVSNEQEVADAQFSTEYPESALGQLRYYPLDIKAQEIRLLEILHNDDDHYVDCTLETTSLNSSRLQGYVALSYCWGDSNLTTKARVNESMVDVTQNLDAALRQLRFQGYHRVWVDAICVNQADKEERGAQVRIMQQIYSSALRVISWIGSVDDDTAEAVKFLLERSSSSQVSASDAIDLEEMTPLPSPLFTHERPVETAQPSPRYSRLEKAERRWIRNQWSIIQDFFSQDYWKRVWVIQEVVVATDVMILYGKSKISWDYVAAAIVIWKRTLMSLPTGHLSHLYAAQLLDLREQFRNKSRMSIVDASESFSFSLAT